MALTESIWWNHEKAKSAATVHAPVNLVHIGPTAYEIHDLETKKLLDWESCFILAMLKSKVGGFSAQVLMDAEDRRAQELIVRSIWTLEHFICSFVCVQSGSR